jgi:hypothetical protein
MKAFWDLGQTFELAYNGDLLFFGVSEEGNKPMQNVFKNGPSQVS